MALYRNIQITFWTDPKVADEFSPEDKFFYLYLFTNPHTNLCGCYEISKKQVSWETGYSLETIELLLERFEKIHKVISFSAETKELLLINWHKYNWTKSADFRKALSREIEGIKNQRFKEYLYSVCEGGDTVPAPSYDGGGTTDTDTIADTVKDTDTVKAKSTRFTPPTLEEVKEYCLERKNNVDAERFIDFYASKGWMVGKNKMKDWKACVRTWEQRNKTEAKPVEEDENSKARREKYAELEKYYLGV